MSERILLDWDNEIEREIIWLWQGQGHGAAVLKDERRTPASIRKHFSARIKARITKGYKLGLSAEAMKKSLRLNLVAYNFAPDTFPLDEWLEAVVP